MGNPVSKKGRVVAFWVEVGVCLAGVFAEVSSAGLGDTPQTAVTQLACDPRGLSQRVSFIATGMS